MIVLGALVVVIKEEEEEGKITDEGLESVLRGMAVAKVTHKGRGPAAATLRRFLMCWFPSCITLLRITKKRRRRRRPATYILLAAGSLRCFI